MKNYFRKILSLFTKNKYSQSAQQQFYRWLLDDEHFIEKDNALRSIWDEGQKKMSIGPEEIDKSYQNLKKNTRISSKQQKKLLSNIRIWQTAAAALLILAMSSAYFAIIGNKEVDLIQEHIPVAEMGTIILPDGSEVLLNSGTTLLYPKKFTGKNRSVFLIGEANFKVKPDAKHPFIVKSNDFQVTALGTEFNISAYPSDEEIVATLISGSIQVEYDDLKKSVILTPNQQLSYKLDNREYLHSIPDIDDVTAWQRGELVFQKMTVKDIIKVLERKYNYSFEYSIYDLKSDFYSFRFSENAPLSEVMNIIINVVGNLDYQIKGDKCLIYKKK